MKKQEGATFGIWLDLETKAEIERIADKVGITPSQLGRNLLLMGVQEVRTMEKFGILQAAVMFEELRGKIRERMQNETVRFGGELQAT